jgi:hypothetical protein
MSLSRRSLTGALIAGAAGPSLAALFAPARAAALPAGTEWRFSRLSVDVGPLYAKGLGPNADLIGQALAVELRRSFADRLSPGDRRAPALVVRISAISMSTNFPGGGSGRRGHGGGSGTDYLEGEGLVVDGRGGVIATYPMLSALAASYAGTPWYDPRSEQRRMVALAWHYAYWLRRTILGR